MMRTILIFLILALLAPAASAADVTEVPAGVSTEAVKAFRRGLELHRAKRWESAIKEYERAIELGGRAYCYRKTGRTEKAIELYRIAIQLRPIFPQAHDYLARAYLAKGGKAAALREYEIVRRLDSKLAHCLKEAIARNDPDYKDMPWNESSSGVASSRAA